MNRRFFVAWSLLFGSFAACGGSDTSDVGNTANGPTGGQTSGAAGASSGAAGTKSGAAGTSTSGNGGVAGTTAGKSGNGGNAAGNGGFAGNVAGAGGADAMGVGGFQGGNAGTTQAGTGGVPPTESCKGVPACGVSACGDGQISVCMVCSDGPGGLQGGGPPPVGPMGAGGFCSTVQEACDGTNLGGASCTALGYGGDGTVTCSATCELDASKCTSCKPSSSVTCLPGTLPTTTQVAHLTLVHDGKVPVVGWSDTTGAYVALLDPMTLAPTQKAGPFGAPLSRIAVAPTSLGYLVVLTDPGGSFGHMHLLSPQLADTPVGGFDGYGVTFGQRSDGPLALAWGQGLVAHVLSPAGTTLASSESFSAPIVEPEFANVDFDGTNFVLAQRGPLGAQLFRISLTATVTKLPPPGSPSTEYPRVAASSGAYLMTYNDFGVSPATVNFRRFDQKGAPLGPLEIIGSTPEQFNVAPVIDHGGAPRVLLGGYTGQTGVGKTLDVLTVGGAKVPVAAAPAVSEWQWVPDGGSLVVGWIVGQGCGSRVELARVTP